MKSEKAFPTHEVHGDDPEEKKSHMNVPAGWAILNCGVAKRKSGAELAGVLAQACEKEVRGAGDDGKAEAVEEKYHVRGIGEIGDNIIHQTVSS